MWNEIGMQRPSAERLRVLRRRDRRSLRKCTDPAYRKQFNKRRHLRKQFDLSLEDYQRLLEAQGGCCAICGLAPGPDDKDLAVDHNHNTNVVRGLLCGLCNPGIGIFKEDVRLLQRAIEYLRERGSKLD